jgi:voltage-gated potassium channel
MFPATRAMLSRPESKVLLISAVLMIVLGTVVYMFLEGWTLVDALYFSVVALATVGFGDLHPTTDAAKLFTVLYIVSGLGVLGAFIAEFGRQRSSAMSRRHADADH